MTYKTEKGMVKRDTQDGYAYCNEDWDNFEDYTAQRTDKSELLVLINNE